MSTQKTNAVVDPQKFLEPVEFVHMTAVTTATGLTAGTTQTQAGGTPITAVFTRVSTTAVANDGVRLPKALAGNVLRIRNAGAENLKIWPADGEKCNTGTADAADATVLATTATRTYVCFAEGDWTNFGV